MKIGDVLKLSDPEPRLADLRLLVSHYTGFSVPELSVNAAWDIPSDILTTLLTAMERLKCHEPPQYIIGEACFMGYDLRVNPDVLIPRPETERLVEIALGYPIEGSVVDVGTGSGAIAISLKLAMPDLDITATDISAAALNVARENAQRHNARIEFVQCDLFPDAMPQVNAIISNPPYISAAEYAMLDPMVREYEPRLALLASDEGMACYRRLLAYAPRHLLPGGLVFLEHGHAQQTELIELAAHYGFTCRAALKDYNDYHRYLVLQTG